MEASGGIHAAPGRGRRMLHSATTWTVLATFVATFLLALYVATQHTAASVYDEGPHFDYIYKLLHGHLPKTASPLSQETIWELTCRGGLPWYQHPHCMHIPLPDVPVHGVNSALLYFPMYYGIAAIIAAPLHALGVDLYTAARIASCLFYAAGTALLTFSLIRLRLSRVAALGVGLGVMAIPAYLYQGATVTPDSMAMLCGALSVFLLTLRVSWSRRVVYATIAATAMALTKPNFLPLAGITVLLALLVHPSGEGRATVRLPRLRGRNLRLTLLALVLPVLAAGGWELFRSHDLAPGETQPDGGLTESLLHTKLGLGTLILQAAQYMGQPFSSSPFDTSPQGLSVAIMLAHGLLIGGTVVIALMTRREQISMGNVAAIAGLAGLALSAVYLPATFYLTYHSTGTVPRYAFPMVPLCAAGIALTVSGRFTRWVILAGGVLFTVYVFTLVHRFFG
jgi:hypothetical protein